MKRMVLAALAFGLAAPAGAMNMSMLKDAPISRLSKEELKEFRASLGKVLDEAQDGKTVEWKAPKSTFVSKITPERSFTEGARKCREATIESDSGDRFQRGRYMFCKNDQGRWQFRQPEAKARSK